MPDRFFASKKRKRTESSFKKRPNGVTTKSKLPYKKTKVDEELSDRSDDEWRGVDDMDLRPEEPDPGASGDEDEDETPAEKRLRLAQMYLDGVKESLADGEYDAAEIDKELISSRLKKDVLEHSGKVHLFIADSYNLSSPPTLRTRGHRFSVTSAVAAESGQYLFTSGKEGNIIKWDISSARKLKTFYKIKPPPSADTSHAKGKGKGKAKVIDTSASDVNGHSDEVLTLALSSDGKYLVSGGKDRRLIVWDAEKGVWLKTFQGPMNHKDAISALSFRKSSHQLFTASLDRSLKVYDLSPTVMGYVETLFGHQDHVHSLDSLRGDNCVSVGGRDKTARYWKIIDETQLVFRGGGRSRIREILEGTLRADDMDVDHEENEKVKPKNKEREQDLEGFVEGSLDCIAMIDEITFVTGGDSGYASLLKSRNVHPLIYPLSLDLFLSGRQPRKNLFLHNH
ncbi:hypothetical protein AGABI1DRAFT_42174 [Agaricus bisporus var. burnettii JB137-S8]|uniref:Uncharacterized protein n=1 Tax=Agaricus bisporus var. burnettii (strain JB137-S8 / ATCC MYA-4627 / FGSC 10392) TaxID=597362 RepID=K5X5S6_AGABU|nr:uncharacterized protein AGABI1DRAFT_42174 [Agaricus bisporus var. burnettii JB137-S8]EKM78533.1 hypothetical protein AGABI1DRAFT_42174 [Agaricus bisporus var. burnettii JB137-S8]